MRNKIKMLMIGTIAIMLVYGGMNLAKSIESSTTIRAQRLADVLSALQK